MAGTAIFYRCTDEDVNQLTSHRQCDTPMTDTTSPVFVGRG